MALDNVLKEIIASADADVREIQAQQAAEIGKIEAEADAAIAEMKEKEDKKLKDAVELLKRQEISSAELESKKIVLSKKKEILAKVFEDALDELESTSGEDKLRHYQAMVSVAKKVIDSPKAFVSKDDTFTASQLGVSSVEADPGIRAGIILQSADGTAEVDMQYETLLQTIWDREIKALSDILFG
jgi:V/A-type H+-transporting ATPase subunit E